jgi:hypothetical protein
MKGQRKNKQDKGRRKPQLEMISHPPEIKEYSVRHGTRLRFVANSALNGAITFQNLLDTMLVAATAILGYDQFYSVKVRFVEVWASPLLGSAVTVSVAFVGITAGEVGDQRFHTDTSMGIEPAHVRAVPSLRSLASQFQLNSAAEAFLLTCPSGAVVDVGLTFVQTPVAVAVAAQNALVGATVGAPYWRGLDGLAIGTTKLTPVVANATI